MGTQRGANAQKDHIGLAHGHSWLTLESQAVAGHRRRKELREPRLEEGELPGPKLPHPALVNFQPCDLMSEPSQNAAVTVTT